MDLHALKVLEYESVLAMLIERAETEIGAEYINTLAPSTDLNDVHERLALTSEARLLLEKEGSPSFMGISDIASPVQRAERGSMLQPMELIAVGRTLSACSRVVSFIHNRAERVPKLNNLTKGISVPTDLDREINDTFDCDGSVRDSADPELGKIRSKRGIIHNRLIDRLQKMMSGSCKSAIQEPTLTQREGRYCLPIKADYRGKVKGIVHDTSASGATLYIEPEDVVHFGNELREIDSEEKRIIERILSTLSARVGASAGVILALLSVTTVLDAIFAKGKLSLDMDAIEPNITEEYYLYLRKARHPLIPKDRVVPLDIELGKRYQALIITGPNTGGKTVSMKTVGLFILMAQLGLHVPANDARLPLLKNVFADIGDEQSLQQSLSTFSAHMSNIVHILKESNKGSLVLLDEVGAGTDPAEGAALAKAILAELVNRGVLLIASTHYGELKAYAYNTPGFSNSAMEFDSETLRPTYRLKLGAPGASHALTIAERLGLPSGVVEMAKEQLGEHQLDTIKMIEKLEVLQKSAEDSQMISEKLTRELQTKEKKLNEEIEKIETIRKETKNKSREQVQELLSLIRHEAEAVMNEIKKTAKDSKVIETARTDLKKLDAVARELSVELIPMDEPLVEKGEVHKGDRVRVEGYSQVGTVVHEPKDGNATVSIGPLRFTVSTEELEIVREKPKSEPKKTARINIGLEKTETISSEIHLRMMRVEEALYTLDKYLEDAAMAGLPSVRVVHGKGTGTLRQVVRKHLSGHAYIKSYREAELSEGGEGVTIAYLK